MKKNLILKIIAVIVLFIAVWMSQDGVAEMSTKARIKALIAWTLIDAVVLFTV